MISEIKLATVAVSDLKHSCDFYGKTFDYVIHAEGTVSGAGYEALWQMPAGMTGKVVVMGPEGATTGLLRLVQFSVPGTQYWGNYETPQNYGHYALNIRVPEIKATIAGIKANGGSGKSTPTHWTVSPDLSAWDSLSYDPDGTILDCFELEPKASSLMADYDGKYSTIQTVAIHSSHARESARFYAALGFRPWYDKMLVDMEDFFKLPKGTALHNINMVMPGDSTAGRLEIAQYVGFPGVSQRDVAVPPNLGLLAASMQTTDLEETIKLLHSIGTEPISEVVELEMAGLGRVRARSYFGPDDEVLEFFELA